ncbi:MAG TPA: zinc ribbon domain-containing protein [Polyangia bacterium]|nr:zinc ribbon domain-containing protein [Polyangia bacterium]
MKEDTLSAAAQGQAASTDGAARPRRRVPTLWLGLGGAAVTLAYGVGVMHVREGAPLVMMALGGLTLVLCGIALWRVLDPLSRADLSALETAAPRSSGRIRELEREKQLVLKAIKEIELDYQMRKIAEADYKDLVERYRGRALRIMSELEAGDNFRPLIERELRDRVALAESKPAAAAPAAAGVCQSCGTQNDEDAQFCKKCGAKVASS